LGYKQITTGFFIDKNIELEGGNLITLSFSDANFGEISDLRDRLQKEYKVTAYTTTSAIETQLSIECSGVNVSDLIEDINKTLEIKNYEVTEIDPKLSSEILGEIIYSVIFAFIAIAIIIFILFRVPVPSFAVVLCAFSDIIITLFLMNILGITLSIATFIALLMVLGYSVDTDILLTTRVLKQRENFDTQYKSALKTGLTMSATSSVALLSILLITGFSSVFGQLASVLIIALLVDIPNTWIQNATILDIYLEKRGR
jgi:preprotein translocase subunit SecF